MKAWEMEHELMARARPKLRDEDDQTWDAIAGLERHEDGLAKMMWYSEVPGSGAPERLMVAGVQALENRGMIVDRWKELVDEGLAALERDDMPALHEATGRLQHAFRTARTDTTSPYWEYEQIDDWDSCRSRSRFPEPVPYRESYDEFRRRVHGGWLGQVVAGALGTAIEGYTADALQETLGEIRGYPVTPNTVNDDVTYELAFLKAMERTGDPTGEEIASQWVALIPFGWSAELVALRNLRAGLMPPESGSFNNPYREWIGAQMRGAVCGMMAPGDATAAARLAWIDGEVSHAGNGILGEVFNAVMVSLAFVESDARTIVEQAVHAIPPRSEYASVVRFALEQCSAGRPWRDAWKECEVHYRRYNWVHAYPNACAEVIALWYGAGDFDETMHIIAMEGQDVDCNAAQIANVLGVIGGPESIPERWSEPVGDTLHTYVRTMKRLSIRDLADWTARIAPGRPGR